MQPDNALEHVRGIEDYVSFHKLFCACFTAQLLLPLQVPGRLYPISLIYCPPPDKTEDDDLGGKGRKGRGRRGIPPGAQYVPPSEALPGAAKTSSGSQGLKGEAAAQHPPQPTGRGALAARAGQQQQQQEGIDPQPYLRLLQVSSMLLACYL